MVFKKGDKDINREGRPKGSLSLNTMMREILKEKSFKDKKGRTNGELLVTKVLEKAILKGDHNFVKMIWNNVEGMPKQVTEIEVSSKSEQSEKDKERAEDAINSFLGITNTNINNVIEEDIEEDKKD